MVNGKTLYSKLTPEDVAEYVVVSGDPWRAEMMSGHLEQARHIAFSRAYNTYTGLYKGVRVTVSSTGMGTPSAIEMLEELVDCGAKVIVRMGTAAPFDDNDFGKFLIARAGMATDQVSLQYAPEEYPARVDSRLVSCLEEAVADMGFPSVTGIVQSSNGGMPFLSITKFGEKRRQTMPSYTTVEEYQAWGRYYGLKFMDFESAALIKVGDLMGVTVGSLCLATVVMDRNRKMMHTDPARLKQMEDALCTVSLEGIVRFAGKYGEAGHGAV